MPDADTTSTQAMPVGRIEMAFRTLLSVFGPQNWWPGDSRLEIVVGAVLTQGTAWRNVEAALDRLRESHMLSVEALWSADPVALREVIRPAGFQHRKQKTLSELAAIASRTGGLDKLLSLRPGCLRQLLLAVDGIGPETADAIALYAGGHPVFVVDAYTRRFASRHRLADRSASYDELSAMFAAACGNDAHTMGEFHALLVELGKRYCRAAAMCDECPLRKDLDQTRRGEETEFQS